jgi:hypothetical protein
MLQPKPRSLSIPAPDAVAQTPLFGVIDSVLVEDPAPFVFDGAIVRSHAEGTWTWLSRDIAADLLDPLRALPADDARAAFEAGMPALLARARAALALGTPGSDAERRIRVQVGGAEALQRLPLLLNALKCSPFLDKARAFGRAVNGIQDDAALATALQSMPRHDAAVAALLMMAAIGEVVAPGRLVCGATRIAGGAAETDIIRAGFAPLVDALLAHAQNAIPPMLQPGAFGDMDLVCRAVERFHRLSRAIGTYLELPRGGRWSPVVAALTKTVSDRLAPQLRGVVADINQSLRRPREAVDPLQLLTALNGLYLLATVRDCRDSLALNEIVDEAWGRSGQVLDVHLERTLDALRAAPTDPEVAARLEAGIKMAEIRFGAAYAAVLDEARAGVGRRIAASS